MSKRPAPRERGLSTKAVHGGEDRRKPWDSLTTPIFQTSTFVFHDTDTVEAYTSKQLDRFEYGRYSGPTERAAARKLMELEGAQDAILFASGMAAVCTTLSALLSQGDHIVCSSELYKKSLQFVLEDLSRWGVEATPTPVEDVKAAEKAIRPNTKLVFIETPTNPYLRLGDIAAYARVAHKAGAWLFVDATFATPCNLKPLELGADLVMHSATKYFGGHNDLLAGALLGNDLDLMEKVRGFHKKFGACIDPHCAYLLIRGLKTLPLRMERCNASALKLAKFLDAHPAVRQCFYPGLPSHPQHALAKRMMKGFGGVVSFWLDAPLSQVNKFLNSLELCFMGPSLGGVETLVYHPASTSFYDITREERIQLGILDELVRVAVGCEDVEDLIADFEQALAKVKPRGKKKRGR